MQFFINQLKKVMRSDALTGVVLVTAVAIALLWANSIYSESYKNFFHSTIFSQLPIFGEKLDLRFIINDILMTLFFLSVGLEIRKETYDGALNNFKTALLPILAACGGVAMPALIYSLFNYSSNIRGWAIPTATDIAFAVGLLTLFGKAVSSNIRAILLCLAIVDDIIAVIIIAIFYSNSGNFYGLIVVIFAAVALLSCQGKKFFRGWHYIIAIILVWLGLASAHIHPSLAGVLIGLIMPVATHPQKSTTAKLYSWVETKLISQSQHYASNKDAQQAMVDDRELKIANSKRTSQIFRKLSPWVNFFIMPLFALANAGVDFGSVSFDNNGNLTLMAGIILSLVFGKPIGIFAVSYFAVKAKFCRLPGDVRWSSILWIGTLAGIGFTMSLFVAMLAFHDHGQLISAKFAILIGSGLSAIIAVIYGSFYLRRGHQE